jgi:3-dehydro-L-gulonate 2-dehydrogenase
MAHVTFDEMQQTLCAVFAGAGVPHENAELCATVISRSTFDGVFSHGVRQVPGLIAKIRGGSVSATEAARQARVMGALEQWDGRFGIGVVNATRCTDRAIELAGEHGVGCVGLRNTSHWLRAGSYGRQAVERGYALVCWTNTAPNMPAWGALTNSVGNNPLVLAVPHPETPLVLDIAMSQFALGALGLYSESGRPLPVPGGYDPRGELSTDAAAIREARRVLPMGYWKGSGLALALDALATALTAGNSTADYARMGEERGVSQVFIAFDVERSAGSELLDRAVREIQDLVHHADPVEPGGRPYAPGEGALRRRRDALTRGLDIDDALWEQILALRP